MQHLNFDLGILTETKIMDDKYTPLQFGFRTLATQAPSSHQGGVVLFWHYHAAHWHLEDPYPTSPNSIITTLVSGDTQYLIIRVYILSSINHTPMLQIITQTIDKHPRIPPIILGDLNANLAHPTTHRNIDLSTLIHQHHLKDAISLFQQKHNHKYIWPQKCNTLPTKTSKCDYILTPYKHQIANAQICIPDLFKLDHYAIWVLLPGANTVKHQCIKCHCSTLPTIEPKSMPELISNCKLNILQEQCTTLKLEKATQALEKQQCIKEACLAAQE